MNNIELYALLCKILHVTEETAEIPHDTVLYDNEIAVQDFNQNVIVTTLVEGDSKEVR